ncbi:MAG: hypothetical protein KDC35_12980 [Acidobacteria bacterium]|nr:hypothetical protein [Acidobacteriota bacterium]
MTCAIGCGILLVLVVVFFFGSIFWLTKKGEFEAETTLLNAQSEFFIEAYVTKEDQILVEFLTQLSNVMNQQNPMMARYPFLAEWNERGTRKDLQKLLPLKIEVAGSVAEEDFRSSVGFSLYNNLADLAFWFLKRSAAKKEQVREYEGETYVALEEDSGDRFVYLALRDSVFYLTNTEPGIQACLTNELDMDHHLTFDALAGVDLDAPIYGYATGQSISPQLLAIIDIEDPELTMLMAPDFLQRIAFFARVPDQTTLQATLDFYPLPSSDPDRLLQLVQSIKENLEQRENLNIQCVIQQETYRTRLDMSFLNMDETLRQNITVSY